MLDLLALVLVITPSGALSPGPLTAAAVALGSSRGWRAGLAVATGHAAFELPYVMALSYALAALDVGRLRIPLSLAASAAIFLFACLLVRDAVRVLRGAGVIPGGQPGALGPFLAGLALTALNPYFLLWWASVALPLVARLGACPPHVFAAVYAAHVWVDYLWLSLMALLGSSARRALSARGYAAFLAAMAAVLAYFGVSTLHGALPAR
ncbi:MAG: LysE family translocator [Thermoproteaceae archaeon]|jgi:threonine/homoserine/homoserine lactone efflux protein|nr:LysE family translocator [Thermoproteaceae archaeon]